MVINFSKNRLLALSLSNAAMILQNAISMSDEYIAKTYGSEKNMLEVANGYVDLAIKILENVPVDNNCAELRITHNTEEALKPLGGKDIDGNEYLICRHCSAIVSDGTWKAEYCPDCGKKIDWSDSN